MPRMLHVSDNQFAEQVLLMTSAEQQSSQLKPMVELRRITDSLRGSTTAGSPVRWVDGSGLSRYNLFTPNVIIALLAVFMPECLRNGYLRYCQPLSSPEHCAGWQ